MNGCEVDMSRPDALPLISVVVPVYNVEAYLRECVQSVLSQSYAKLEVILVDDGSTDGSGTLCDELAQTDGRIQVIHKANGGLSDARNVGLCRAAGAYVSFIDSDDYVSPAFIEALYSGIVGCGTRVAAVPGGHPFHDGDQFELASDAGAVAPASPRRTREYQGLMLYQTLATGAPWRLYERGVLGDDPFPVGLYYEDLASTYRLVCEAGEEIALVDSRELYAYRLRATSIIRQSYRHVKAASALTVTRQLRTDICNWYPELSAAVASRCFSTCRMVFAQVPTGKEATEETECDRDELWAELVRHRSTVLRDPQARKRERLAAGIACLGEGPFTLFCKACRRVGLLQ